jgi:quercetin dioxygenase-like cupin family protein
MCLVNVWNLASLDIKPSQPVVLQSDEGAARVIALRLPAGHELQEHEVHEHAWLHVHSGEVEVVQDGETTRTGTGSLVHWRPQERRTVRGVEDALLILILAPWPGPGHPGTRAHA